MMRVLLPAVLLLAACKSTPLPPPDDESAGIVGARAWVEQLQRGTAYSGSSRTKAADGVYFVKLPDEGDSVISKEVIKSTINEGSVNFAINLKPGRYAIVAAWANRDGKNVHTYFPEKCVRQSIVELKPGGIAFTGEVRVRGTYDLAKSDRVQNHYFRTIDPKLYSAGIGARMIARNDAMITRSFEVRRGQQTQEYFASRARTVFAGTLWLRNLRQAR